MGKKRKKPTDRRAWQTVTLCISTTMVLVLLGFVVLTVLTARNLSDSIRENFTVTMMLSDEMTATEGQQFVRKMQTRQYVSHAKYISKDQAMKEGMQALGAEMDEMQGSNPFPASIELNLRAEYTNEDSLIWIKKDLQAIKNVSEVEYPADLIKAINTNINKISIVLLVIAALLLTISVSLINNSVRLSVYAHRFRIHTMKLVGASWGFIRKPHITRAMLIGTVAALAANSILGAGVYALISYEPDSMELINWEVWVITGAAVFIFGLLITVICTWISVGKFLRMKAGELYRV